MARGFSWSFPSQTILKPANCEARPRRRRHRSRTRRALEFPHLIFLELPREAQPALQEMQRAADFFFGAFVGQGDAADALLEEMALKTDVDEFFGQAERTLQQRDHQRMRE